jgi:two-component system response regulator RpfG
MSRQWEWMMNVMIIDDQPSSRMLLRCVLERMDMQLLLHEFADPEEALIWCENFRPDFVLLDYMMPGMDGIEFARRFRMSPKHQDVPIVLVTACVDEDVHRAAVEAGILDVVLKPIKPRDLKARCTNVMNLRQKTELKRQDCPRRLNFEPPCRLNIEPGRDAVGCFSVCG